MPPPPKKKNKKKKKFRWESRGLDSGRAVPTEGEGGGLRMGIIFNNQKFPKKKTPPKSLKKN